MTRKASVASLTRNASTKHKATHNRFASLKDEYDVYERRAHFAELPMANVFAGLRCLQYNACRRKTGAAFMAEMIELWGRLIVDFQEAFDALS